MTTIRREKARTYPYDGLHRYDDEHGNVLSFVGRIGVGSDKRFAQFEPKNLFEGKKSLGNARRVLYNLPNLMYAVEAGLPIHIAEGEKCADLITDVTGEIATTNPMGAGKWNDGYSRWLRGAVQIVIHVDKDDAGRKHAGQVYTSVKSVLDDDVDIRVVEAAEDHHDVGDHLEAGFGLDALIPVDPTTLPLPADRARPTERRRKARKRTGTSGVPRTPEEWVTWTLDRLYADVPKGSVHTGRSHDGPGSPFTMLGQMWDNACTEAEMREAAQLYRERMPQVDSEGKPSKGPSASDVDSTVASVMGRPRREPWSAGKGAVGDGPFGMVSLDEVETQEVEWLWENRLPRGKGVIFDGGVPAAELLLKNLTEGPDEDASRAAIELRTAQEVLNRLLGKARERVDVSHELRPWEKVVNAAVVYDDTEDMSTEEAARIFDGPSALDAGE